MQLIDDRIAAFGLILVALTAWGSNILGSQAYMMNCIGLAALAFMLIPEKKKEIPFNKWVWELIVPFFGIYSACWFAYIQIAESQKWMPDDSMVQSVDVLTLIMSGYVLYIIIKFGRASKVFWMNVICVLSIILSCIGILQYFKVAVATATLICTNYLAAFLAITTIFFFRGFSLRFYKIWKIKIPYSPLGWWLFIPLVGFALYLTHTSTAIAAFCISLGFYAWGWKGAGLAIIPGVAYWLIFKMPDSLLERISFWTDAVQKLSGHWEKLVFGTGPSILWQTDNMLHSEYFYLLWNFGLIGLIIAAFYIIRSCRKVTNRVLFASFLAVLVDGIGNHLLHTAPTAMLAIIIFALNDRERAQV
jgi:hypothetical protein